MQSSFPRLRANAKKESATVDGAFGAGDYPIPLPPSYGHNVNRALVSNSAQRWVPARAQRHSTGVPVGRTGADALGFRSGCAIFLFQQKGASVFTGKRFRLGASTLGILSENGDR